MSDAPFKRILLKLSGEALGGEDGVGIKAAVVSRIARELQAVRNVGVEIALVLGGGNLFRGAELAAEGLDRVTGDHIGMVATVMNGLAVADGLRRFGLPAQVRSAFALEGIVEPYRVSEAKELMQSGTVVVLVGGTGNPFFTTDSAACLRGIELGVDIVVKGTKVDGVYSADPVSNPDAKKFDQLSFDEVIDQRLGVMDLTAICLCRDHQLPIRVFNMNSEGALPALARGETVGTLVTG